MRAVEDRELELSEHLQELRVRLIRSVVFIVIGFVAAWFLYDHIYNTLTAPIAYALKLKGPQGLSLMMTRVTEGFMLRCQISLVAGMILAAPLVTYQAWGFVAPALTAEERRPIKWVAPLCVLLFACGVATAYFILPAGMRFFVQYIPDNTELRAIASENLVFVVKMLLAFGLVFELPIVLLFLGKIGVVDSRMLKSGWRHALVGIAVLAAVATPSGDAFSMMAMAMPLTVLYVLSIFLVKQVEPKPLK